MPNVIRVGDPTSHGGKVIDTSAAHIKVSGKPIALLGDRCTCPITGHQNCVIVSGNSRHAVNGKPVAYEGDKTSCGATPNFNSGNVLLKLTLPCYIQKRLCMLDMDGTLYIATFAQESNGKLVAVLLK